MQYLILSDIHSNLAALDAVLAAAGHFDGVWCLGDVVGYGPQPNECAARLRDLPGLHCIAGNHDWGSLGRLDLSEFNPEARFAAEWTGRQLSAETRAWLEALPERIVLEGITLVHGSPRHPIWEYVLSAAVARENLAYFGTLTCFLGHTHVPAIFVESDLQPGRLEVLVPDAGIPYPYRAGRALINPGSVGQPRDGDPRASAIVLDPEAGSLQYLRVTYDTAATQSLMQKAGLPARLSARLSYGL